MTSRRRTVRLPAPSDLHAEPPLGPLLLLDLAAAVAGSALRAHHVAIQGDLLLDEADEVTAARVLATPATNSARSSTTIVAVSLPGSPASVAPTRSERTHAASNGAATALSTGHLPGAVYCQRACNEPASAERFTANRSATGRPRPSRSTASRSATSPVFGRATQHRSWHPATYLRSSNLSSPVTRSRRPWC